MAQVKFYSVGADASKSDANGIYFVTGGELYKGTSRFGLGRVTTVEDTSTLTSAARGDININGGVTKVYDGTNWVVAAEAFTLPAFTTGDDDGQVKLGSVNATVSGWSGLVASVGANTSSIAGLSTTVGGLSTRVGTLETKVSGIESIVNVANGGTVTASSATFTNLTVTDTATFSATTVSADTLTISGSTVEQLADKQIAAIAASTVTSTATGITVGVTTQGGSVTAVSVDATSFGNTMHFRDTVSNTANVSDPVAGDIVIITGVTDSDSSFVNGQEYIYTTASTWELIGDQNSYALNAYAPGSEVVTANASTLPGAVHAIAGAVDTLTTKVSALESAVTGGSSSSTVNGVTVEVVTASTTAAPTVTLSGVGTAASVNFATTVTSDGTALPTQSAVASAIQDAALVWLDASGTAIA